MMKSRKETPIHPNTHAPDSQHQLVFHFWRTVFYRVQPYKAPEKNEAVAKRAGQKCLWVFLIPPYGTSEREHTHRARQQIFDFCMRNEKPVPLHANNYVSRKWKFAFFVFFVRNQLFAAPRGRNCIRVSEKASLTEKCCWVGGRNPSRHARKS